ncbi:hypothetical protein Q5752_006543 [Cryptotrichosporon argae]
MSGILVQRWRLLTLADCSDSAVVCDRAHVALFKHIKTFPCTVFCLASILHAIELARVPLPHLSACGHFPA